MCYVWYGYGSCNGGCSIKGRRDGMFYGDVIKFYGFGWFLEWNFWRGGFEDVRKVGKRRCFFDFRRGKVEFIGIS